MSAISASKVPPERRFSFSPYNSSRPYPNLMSVLINIFIYCLKYKKINKYS